MSGSKGTKVLVCLSYLEKLGFLKRWYNVPSQLSVRFRGPWIEEAEPADAEQPALTWHPTRRKRKNCSGIV